MFDQRQFAGPRIRLPVRDTASHDIRRGARAHDQGLLSFDRVDHVAELCSVSVVAAMRKFSRPLRRWRLITAANCCIHSAAVSHGQPRASCSVSIAPKRICRGDRGEGGRPPLISWDIVDNTAENSWATVQRPDGSYEIVALKPLARGGSAFWTSPVTRKTYPTRWRIDIPALGSRLDVVVTGPRGQVVPGWARRSHRSRERQVQEQESPPHHLRRNDR